MVVAKGDGEAGLVPLTPELPPSNSHPLATRRIAPRRVGPTGQGSHTNTCRGGEGTAFGERQSPLLPPLWPHELVQHFGLRLCSFLERANIALTVFSHQLVVVLGNGTARSPSVVTSLRPCDVQGEEVSQGECDFQVKPMHLLCCKSVLMRLRALLQDLWYGSF